MSHHSQYLVLLALLHKRVEEHDPLIPPKSIHIRIGMSRPFRGIADVDFSQWELKLLCLSVDFIFQRSILKLIEFIEQRLD